MMDEPVKSIRQIGIDVLTGIAQDSTSDPNHRIHAAELLISIYGEGVTVDTLNQSSDMRVNSED